MGPGRYCALGVLAYLCGGGRECLTPLDFRYADLDAATLSKITLLNDYHMLSFPEIADWIEQHIPVEEECPVRKHHRHAERSHA